MLNSLKKIKIENPVDKIINQIRSLVTSGELKPGDKLPPERKLAEHLGVSRAQVREALRKLEFYGIVKTLPQSGSVIAGIGIAALKGLITDVLQLEGSDFKSLVETRLILEEQAAFLAAERRTSDDIIAMEAALSAFENQLKSGRSAIEEDLLFHIKIAEASKNSVLKSLMMVITPDILDSYIDLKVCSEDNNHRTITEHKLILEHIINHKSKEASLAMNAHLQDVVEFSMKIRSELH